MKRFMIPIMVLVLLAAWLPAAWAANVASGPSEADVIDRAQAKVVKIFGAGGFRGMESYQSGILISSEGHIMTVWSYVLDTDHISIHLNDGRQFQAKLLGGDPRLEMAVLKIEAADLPHFDLAKAARADAGKIVATAEADAQRIRETAKREAENLRKQMNVDLDTAARNFLITVEERLERAVVDPVIEENLKPLLTDREFLAKMVEELLVGFTKNQGNEHHIEILLPESKRAELEAWFIQKFRDRASQPLDIRFTDKISFGFKIGVAGTGTHINFSDGLVQVFSEFCSPRFRKHFFAGKES